MATNVLPETASANFATHARTTRVSVSRNPNLVIGAVIQCSSYSLAQLIIARIITGVGNGMHTATIPVWQSECSPPHKRGMLIMVEGALITGGICMSYWIDFAFFW